MCFRLITSRVNKTWEQLLLGLHLRAYLKQKKCRCHELDVATDATATNQALFSLSHAEYVITHWEGLLIRHLISAYVVSVNSTDLQEFLVPIYEREHVCASALRALIILASPSGEEDCVCRRRSLRTWRVREFRGISPHNLARRLAGDIALPSWSSWLSFPYLVALIERS